RARAARVLDAPNAVEQLVAREERAGIPEEVREQVELLRGQLDGLAGDRDLVGLAVEDDVAEREHRPRRLRLRPPEDGLHPRDDPARRQRLREVVVGAALEPDDPIGLLVACGQHHDWHLRARPDRAADVEAVHPRQPDVEHHHPDRVTAELDEGVLAGAHPDHAVAVPGQVAPDELPDRRLVLDEQDGSGQRPRVRGPPPPYPAARAAAVKRAARRPSLSRRVTTTRVAGKPSTPRVVAWKPGRTCPRLARRPAIRTTASGATLIVTML